MPIVARKDVAHMLKTAGENPTPAQVARVALLAQAAERLLGDDTPGTGIGPVFESLAPHLGLDCYWEYDCSHGHDSLRLMRSAGISQETAPAFQCLRFGETLCGTCAADRVPVILNRVQHSVDPKADLVRRNGSRAYVCYPLIVKEQLLGTLGFASRSRDTFERDDIEFLGTIARYVAVAKGRRRAEVRLKKRTDRSELLGSVAAALLAAQDSAVMMQTLFEMIKKHLELDGYLAYAVDETESTARLEAWAGIPDAQLPALASLELSEASSGAWRGQGSLPPRPMQWDGGDWADRIKRAGFRTVAAHQLQMGTHCLGVLWFGSVTKPSFDADEVEFFRTVCHYAAMAKERLRLLAELRHREDMLLRAQRAAKVGLWEIDLRTDRLTWSDAYYELFQLDRHLPPSFDRWLARIHTDDRAGVEAQYQRTIPENDEQDFEYRIMLPDGTVRWMQRKGQIDRDEQGRPMRLIGLTFDITERKRGDAALRASEERWQLAVDGSTDGMWDWDPRSHRVFLSSRWKTLRGYTEEEIGDGDSERFSRIHPEDLDRVMRTVQLYLAKRIPVFECEYRTRCKDGSYRWINDRGQAVWDEEGRAVRMVGSEIDITDRKWAEERITELNRELGERAQQLLTFVERLRESEDQLRVITDSVPSPIAYVDRAGRYQFVNRGYEHLFDRSGRDIIGRSVEELSAEDYETIRPHIARVLAGEALSFESSRVLRDDRRATMLVSYTPDRRSDGTVSGFYILVTDISDRKRAEEGLREFNTQLEQRVEERTIELVKFQGRLRALATELNLSEQRQRQRLSEDLHDYLAQLLVSVRLKLNQAKRSGLPPASMDFIVEADSTLTQALTYTRSLIAELSPPVLRNFGLLVALRWLADQMRQHELAVSLNRRVDDISVPEEQAVLLFQSVRELLINVSKHAGTDRAVVTVYKLDGMLCIEVKDEGRGFDLKAAQLADGAPSESSQYGLFSIRERMCAMGGDFDLESTPGRGTKATLLLPLAPQTATLPCADVDLMDDAASARPNDLRSQDAHSAFPPRSPVRVLLADDHAMLRHGLRSVLAAYPDVEVIGEASDGEEAVRLAQSLQPEVVVMDVNMPGVDGIEATRQLRQEQPTIAVVGLSVHNNPQIEESMRDAGATGFLTKESAVKQLYLVIREALGKTSRS
jgi:PAS domain S-box-containing protein